MGRIYQFLGSIAETLGVALAAYAVILGVGCVAGNVFEIGAFQGCLLFLGSCLMLLFIWAVRTVAGTGVALGKEIRCAVEELESFWTEAESEPQEEWQDWCDSGTEHPVLKDRMGGSLCPCGSGKPYRLCCGKKN